MKKIYLWIVAAMVCLGILPVAAQDAQVSDITFKVIIANASGIKCSQYGDDIPLVDGENVFSVPNGTGLNFSATLPWKITGVTNKNGTAVSSFYGSDWYLYVDASSADEVYTISVVNIDEYRTSQFTLNVDDPSLVFAVMSGYNQTLTLEAGENVVKYDPAVENFLYLSPANYSLPLYSVKLNGVDVVDLGGSYYSVELSEGCVVDVKAILPDEDCTVSFRYSEGAEGSISVKANYENVPDFDGKSMVVKIGTKLTIDGEKGYKFDAVQINGVQVNFYNSYSFSVMKDTEIYIDSHPYGTASATLVVTNPDLISISRNGSVLDLTAGDNIIEFLENESNISWVVNSTAVLNSVTVNGTPLPSYQTYYTLNNNDVLVFDVEEKVFDQQAVVWVDNVNAKACSMYLEIMSNNDRSVRFPLDNAYNIMNFYKGMNPFMISWYGTDPEIENVHLQGKVYLNDQLLSSEYESSSYYNVDLANNDVLKFFMESTPEECKVAFDITAGIEANVVKDIVTVVENPTEGFDCFAGTQVSVSGKNLVVSVNNTEIDAVNDEDGTSTYTFIVEDANTEVTISGKGSGVEVVNADADAYIFNMQGIKVGKKSDLNNMVPGIYIVNGKKTVVR